MTSEQSAHAPQSSNTSLVLVVVVLSVVVLNVLVLRVLVL
jgi:hypothetical protein